ncbi:MAG: trimethylamine methyltransferase family protein [Anaerolineae bacterium]
MLRVLRPEDIEAVHGATLEILEKTGAWFHDSPRAVALLAAAGCPVEGAHVRLPRRLVEHALTLLPPRDSLRFLSFRYSAMPHAIGLRQGESHIGIVGNAYYIFDYGIGGARDCVESDVDDKELIVDNLTSYELAVCNLIVASSRSSSDGRGTANPYDDPEQSRAYLERHVRGQRRRPFIHARNHMCNHWMLEERRLDALAQMAVRGRAEVEGLLQEDKPLVWMNPISPLQYHGDEVADIIDVAERNSPNCFVMVSPEVMFGATGPVTLAGSLVQHNAEVLAATVLTQLVKPGTPVIYGCVSGVMDLRKAEISHGNLETPLFSAAAVQLADRYGMPSRVISGNTSARAPGVRACTEASLGLYMALASGANIITTGLLDSTLMVSYEHLVVVDELARQIRHTTRGLRVDEQTLAVDLIHAEGHPSPGFLSADHTLEFMKEEVYYSDFVGRCETSYEDWYQKAHTRVRDPGRGRFRTGRGTACTRAPGSHRSSFAFR